MKTKFSEIAVGDWVKWKYHRNGIMGGGEFAGEVKAINNDFGFTRLITTIGVGISEEDTILEVRKK